LTSGHSERSRGICLKRPLRFGRGDIIQNERKQEGGQFARSLSQRLDNEAYCATKY